MKRHLTPSARFSEISQQLERWRIQLVDELKQGDASSLAIKVQLEDAIQTLRFCDAYRITPSAKVVALPPTGSEYRVIEDNESDDPIWWRELKIDGQTVSPLAGTLLISV